MEILMSDINKRLHFKDLIDKMNFAYDNEFYFETVWLAYSLIEGRVDSALNKSGGYTGRRLFGDKLEALIGRVPVDLNLKRMPGYDNVLSDVRAWKDKRNNLMHSLADSIITGEALESECLSVAQNGKDLARKMLNYGNDLRNLVSRI